MSLVLAVFASGAALTLSPPDDAVPAAAAPQQEEPKLDEDIVVNGRYGGYRVDVSQVGAFRNRALLDTPATVQVVTRALMDAQGVTGLEGALRNTPGITQQTTSPFNTNTFNVRGLQIRADTNYRLNGGLPIINYAPMPVEDKQRVELLKGTSALYYGFATPSGILNLVTKRAGAEPVTTFYADGDSEGGYGGGFDIGRRFGAQDQFGVRINGYASHMESTTDGVSGHRELIAGAFDWQASDRLSLKADLEYYHRSGEEPGGITLPSAVKGVITLPAIPDPSLRFAPEGAPFSTYGVNAMLRASYALGDDWSLRVEGGYAAAHRNRMIATLGSINLATGAGKETITYTPDQLWQNDYGRVELAGSFDTLGLRNELVVGVSRTGIHQDDQKQLRYTTVSQNLYAPVAISIDSLKLSSTTINAGSTNVDTGLYAMDIVHLGGGWQLIGGGRYVDYRTVDATDDYSVHTVTPTAALLFKPSAKTSLYASYIEGLESAGTAPDGTANEGKVMGPQRSKQWEIGGRAELLGAMASLAWFHIDRGLAYTDAATNLYVLNGRAVHQGVEAQLQGRLTRELQVSLAGQYLDAVQKDTGVAAQDGKRVTNTARWSGSAFVEYGPRWLEGFAINGGAYYTGQRYSDALNLASLPGYTTYSLGGSYRWQLADKRRITLRVNGDNITDKRYWATGGTTLYAGQSRTVRASLTLDL